MISFLVLLVMNSVAQINETGEDPSFRFGFMFWWFVWIVN